MRYNLLDTKKSLLLIIDVQGKLLNAQFDKEKVAKNASILAEMANVLNIPVILTEQYPQGLGNTINEVKEKLSANAKIFEKNHFDCCEEDGFDELVCSFGRRQILVCGMESHICVQQTVFSLLEQGYEVHLIQDAISSRKEWDYKQGLKRMRECGSVLSSVEMAMFELLRCTSNPHFKTLQKLIK